MASPTPKRNSGMADTAFRKYPPRPPAGPPEVVDPVWLLKAIGLAVLAALVCGYVTLCFLLYQGQWQLILHPSRTTGHPAQLAGTAIEFLRFGPDASGLPQRTAWAIPAAAGSRYGSYTVLFLPSGDGSLADAVPALTLLHEAGVNLFAIDYRGYGESSALHPSQEHMSEDAAAARLYLIQSRSVPERKLLLYGAGLGTSLVVQLAAEHPTGPAVILDSPALDPLQTVTRDPRTHLLPVSLLLHERFPLAAPLASLKTSKLLFYTGTMPESLRSASDPKMSMQLLSREQYPPSAEPYLQRFLDQSLTP